MIEETTSFWDHLEELRLILIKIVWVILIGTGIAFVFHESLVIFLLQPIQKLTISQEAPFETFEIKSHRIVNNLKEPAIFELPEGGKIKNLGLKVQEIGNSNYLIPTLGWVEWEQAKPEQKLLILSPVEGLSMTLKLSLWMGLAVTSPLWLFFIFQFIAPALHQREKYLVLPFLGLSFVFISIGVLFAYKITIPIANDYLYSFNEKIGLNLWSFSSYLDYTLLLILANAVAFELFVIILLLIQYGALKARQMKEKRRHVIVVAFILGAILTPPDVLSQVLMAIPLIILYELTILYASFREYWVQEQKDERELKDEKDKKNHVPSFL
jgi:sec-independent protein translocase protein TatC